MKLLTLNAGLLRVKFLGRTLNEPAPFVAERAFLLPRILSSCAADVIALQEVYEDEHRLALINALAGQYPNFVFFGRERTWSLNNGLMLFSKYPILDAVFIPFEHGLMEEKLTCDKGALLTVLLSPRGQMGIFNLHAVSGGIFHDPGRDDVNALRSKQMAQLIFNARHASLPLTVLVGDFNAGPKISTENYDLILNAGFHDIFTEHAKPDKKITWDPKNPLNARGPHGALPPQRIDHIFISQEMKSSTRIDGAEITLDKPQEIRHGIRRTISDHYGVFAEISFD